MKERKVSDRSCKIFLLLLQKSPLGKGRWGALLVGVGFQKASQDCCGFRSLITGLGICLQESPCFLVEDFGTGCRGEGINPDHMIELGCLFVAAGAQGLFRFQELNSGAVSGV